MTGELLPGMADIATHAAHRARPWPAPPEGSAPAEAPIMVWPYRRIG
jgi:hypothetical protein